MLSDGDDNDSASKRNAAIQKCKENYIEVYTVGFGSANDTILQNIADKTGGKHYKALNAQEIVDIFAELGYMDDFDMTDTDGDGLPDAVEAAGIRLQNGTIIYTDPTNPDSDGDGLLDGEEINPKPFYNQKEDNGWLGLKKLFGINKVQGYYFKMSSNPNDIDSDRDGYDDYTELTIYNSDPIFSEVYFHRWNQGFFSVDYAGKEGWLNYDNTTISYGGNQGWFFDDSTEQCNSWLDNGYVIQNNGCGLISPSDTLLYLALSDQKFSTFDTELVEIDSFGNVTYDSYQDYIKCMNFCWFEIFRGIGVNGISIANGINQYSGRYQLGLKANWNISKNDLLLKIQKMLDCDIPVTFSIGPQSKYGKGIWFYDWIPLENDQYNFQVESYRYIVTGHYATITGLLIDDIKNQKILEISSWGKRFYVNFDEYLNYVGVTSNIVYIRNKGA